jgi:Concanavalin A-like lectin/glucanases superfamily/Secretion system C-terminal sorting domain
MVKNYFKLIVALVFASNVMAQNVPSYVPTNGLVGWWPFNGNANDESGNGNQGKVNGATLTADRNGKANSAFSFDGVNNFIDLGILSSLNCTKPFTISTWFNQNSSPGNDMLFCKGDYAQMNQFKGELAWYGKISFGMRTNGNQQDVIGTLVINNGKWHQGLWVNDGNGNIQIYVDGKIEVTGKVTNLINLNESLVLGKLGKYTNYFYKGQIDDFAVWNRALTQQEITALYTGGTQSALASTKVFVDAPATVNQNQEVEMSISTETLNSADNVIAYQTDFSYDTTRYTYVGNNLTGTLNPSGNAVVNSTKNGKLAISYMSQTALNGAGSLVKLKFKANNTLGQGIFGLSNFLYNTTAITSLKNDTVNTIDVTPPTAKITYSQNPVRKGDSLLITVNFNEKMAVSPVPQLNLTSQNTLANTNLTKVNDTTYTYWWVVEKGNGAVNVNLATGKDLGGNVIVATPTQNPSFTVLPTVFGDIDTNKLVQAYDAALALQYSVGLNPLPTMDPLPWSNWRLAVANVDTVGNVTANDASLILQHSAKLISTFPADAKKRGGDAPTANVSVTQEGNQLVFRATGTLYAFNVFMKDHFNVLGQPEVKDKGAMVASNLNTTTYNVGLASTTPFTENEPFLIIPILTNENVQGTMDIVANTQEKSLSYGKAAGITAINKEVVIVYPNPTKDVVTINNAQGKMLRIVDVQGKEVYNQKVSSSSMEVSMKSLGAKGMYLLHILDANNESIQTKLIVLE